MRRSTAPVDLLGTRGRHDDRHCGAFAKLPADDPPIEVGKTEVEQNEVAVAGGQRRRAGSGQRDLEALALQTGPQRFGDGGVRAAFAGTDTSRPLYAVTSLAAVAAVAFAASYRILTRDLPKRPRARARKPSATA